MSVQDQEKVSQRLESEGVSHRGSAHSSAATEFDGWAGNYDAALERGLAVSGEGKEFFARGRVGWLQRRLNELGCRPETALDFGCGTGASTGLLLELEGVKAVTGVDVSEESIKVARSRPTADAKRRGTSLSLTPTEKGAVFHRDFVRSPRERESGGEGNVRFGTVTEVIPNGQYDLAFCNGVFHHIPVVERRAAAEYVYRSLRPGGVFAFCENNPWNPGTRLVMRRIEFDREAVMLSAGEARRLLISVGFEAVWTDFLFFFPRFLAAFRGLEPRLRRVPLGAQYMCVARKVLADGH
jgi:SAM-dependent methyltransferase